MKFKCASALPKLVLAFVLSAGVSLADVRVEPVTSPHGMVVAAHPEVAQIGVKVLQDGGNAIDAAVAVSLALGIAEPYGSGLGGKLMLLYHDAATGNTYAVDGMDAASLSLDPAAYAALGTRARYDGWSAVAVPGLVAALHRAHERWGARPWAENVQPAVHMARGGFTVLPKTRDFFEERLEKLRGDPDLARLYLPAGELPPAGTLLANEELARTLELLAHDGADAFYRGPIAAAIVHASAAAGGLLTLEDFAGYEARITEPVGIDFKGVRLLGGPPPASGATLAFAILKALEQEDLQPPLRTAENLDRIGRIWRIVYPAVQRRIGDTPASQHALEELTSPAGLEQIRRQAHVLASWDDHAMAMTEPEPAFASTTHFAVVDVAGNVVCATQSLSLHFGAGVVAAGIVMNNSMSNFTFSDPQSPNYATPGRRPRSTITPTIALCDGRPVLAIGIPGASRIPTAVLQSLIDWLVFARPLEQAMGDTRVHWFRPLDRDKPDAIEAEQSLPAGVTAELRERGWTVDLREPAGTGRHFGGINAITINPDGSRTGYADPRRTNAAAGY